VTVLGGTDVTWGAYAWPIHAISPAGVATTEAVYAQCPSGILLVRGLFERVVLEESHVQDRHFFNEGKELAVVVG